MSGEEMCDRDHSSVRSVFEIVTAEVGAQLTREGDRAHRHDPSALLLLVRTREEVAQPSRKREANDEKGVEVQC